MSRSAHQRQQQKLQMQQQLLAQQQMADNEAAAAAAELFDLFCVATTMRQILGLHRNMCDLVNLRPAPLNEFYPKLKVKIRSWKAQALWKKFDARASQRVYAKGNACTGTRVLVIGAGPCGLRTAIEAQLLGAKVVVVEKRDRISRNNVLHLWPFVITDLRSLGAKKFYGKFCAGSIDHISIRQLQCILLKVALLLGVEIHEGVSFERTIEPGVDGCGWRAAVSPPNHAVSHYEFDVLIGADGKRNTLEDFKRKEFRGKLAIAITANFINKKTEAEAKAEEISGVAFIFNQSFFKELYHTTGIDLENIVYYKDETHYFVMTAKKHSLIDKGVILQDFADPAELLASANVNTEKLLDYAREAAEFSTKYQMPNLEFAVNHYGKPDVAMFDFTSMFAAESSCRVIVRKNYRLLQCLVGDSLLEPFWPTGSGCARGFLSSMDAAYVIKLWSNPCNSILGVVAQRESIYRLLNQTTPENLQRDVGSYTVDPASRYPNLNRSSVNVWQIKHLVDSDDKLILEQTFMDTNALQISQNDTPIRRKRRSGDSVPLSAILLRWICAQLHAYDFVKELKEVSDVFTHGKVLCALINRYRPDLVDFNAVQQLKPVECNDLAFRILEKEMHITRIMSGKESLQLNAIEPKVWLTYLEQICEVFRGEIPHIKHPKIDFSELREKYRINHTHAQPDFSKLLQLSSKQKAKSPIHDMVDVPQVISRRSVIDEDKLKRQRRHEQLMTSYPNVGHNTGTATTTGQAPNADNIPRRAKKRRNADKAANIEERQKRLQNIEENRKDRLSKRRQQRYQQTQNFYKSLHMLQANTLLREGGDTPFEDYSIFLYRQQAPEFNDRVKELERKLLYPDRERGDIASALPRGNTDELFSDRIKSMEQRISSRCSSDKKPKDLMRAIGRIDSSDWQIREIEKKMDQSKKTEVHGPKGREKVPKWSKEQFQARQNKMAKPNRQDSSEEKYKEIDQTLKNLDKQLKEGHIMDVGERGRNKVASIAGHFVRPEDAPEEKNLSSTSVPKSSSKVALAFKKQAVSEKCHFCKQTVYLMEKLHIEDLVMHRGCLKCHHCHTNLRLGGYAFDRDDPNGRFYCTQHFRLPAKSIRPVVRKMGQRKTTQGSQPKEKEHSPTNKLSSNNIAAAGEEVKRHAVDNITQMEMLGRGQTPERIEFENTDAMSDGEPSEEHIIDEHEWSGRNFLPESNNDAESDLSTSDESDSDSASDIYEEANDSPLGAQTLQLATDWIGKQNYTESDDSDEFYDSSEGIADDGKDDTEGEEFEKARELRREEVRLQPLPPNLPTDTETEKQVLDENQDSKKEKQLNIESSHITDKSIKCKESGKSLSSQESFKSTASSTVNGHNEKATAFKTRKADMEKLEQHKDHKFSADIEAISQKLYRLNNIMKMNKDLEVVAKENLIRSDILKKLTMKEKWLAAINGDPTSNSLTKFEDKIEKILDTKPKKNVVPILPEKDTQDLKIEKEKTNILRSKENVADNKKKIRNSEKTENISRKQEASEVLKASAHHSKDKMQIESILDVVKSINISKNDEKLTDEGEALLSGLGDVKPNENWMNRFSDRMETIKSQIIEPTVSAQASATVDLSKYFPHEKSEKPSSPNVNKNQKTLKDVDLTKYFPSSPAPQRRTPVVTVADKLKNSQTERNLSTISAKQGTPTVATNNLPKSKIANNKMELSLKDHQLDGSADVVKKKSPIKMVTSTAVATVVKKGNVKIIKKIVPKGTKPKKLTVKIIKTTKKGTKKINTMQDDSDQLLEEILKDDNGGDNETRSPSAEYLKLFKEEKSPSEDISDKIDCILEAEGIDLGIVKKPKKLLKTKSLGEEEFKSRVSQLTLSKVKEDGDEPASGVQNILKLFESMSSLKSSLDFSTFKLQRMESSTQTPLRSKETLMSSETLSQSDLERTMDYLKSEWRNEASNFLKKKRSTYFSEKLQCCEKENPKLPNEKQEMELKKKCVEQKESALPNKKLTKTNKNDVMERNQAKANTKPITYTSLEELALISLSKQETLKQKRNSGKDNGNVVSQKEDNDTNKVNKTMNNNNENNFKTTNIPSPHIFNQNQLDNDDVASLMSDNKTMGENKRPVIEDIRNLPKTGCDKSLSNSRRGSQASIQSRTSIGELCMKGKCSLKSNSSFEEVSFSSKNERNISSHSTDMPEEDSCNNIIINQLGSHNSSAIPYRASSSEEESIEKLFSQFSDEMLVNVEFDSNDELIAITPRVTLLDAEENETDNLTNMKTIEKQSSFTNCENNYEQHFKTLHFDEDSKHVTGFPIKPQRSQRSTSSSSDAALPAHNILSKLSPTNIPPSVQDLMQQTLSIEVLKGKESLKEEDQCLRFPRILDEDEPFEDQEVQHVHHYRPKVNDNDSSSTPKDESVFQFSKVLKPMPLFRESSLEWDMEKLPSSPLPVRKFKINYLANEIDFMDDPTKDYNKIDRNNISGSSTEIQRTEPQLNENFQISESAAISSIQMLNNLDADSETAAHRLIKEYETERRQALALRDKQFQDMEKADLKKETTPPSSIPIEDGPMNITPIISNASKQSSRTSSQPSLNTNRGGTPPMLKTLDIGSDGPSQQSSRRSSFAFIEMIDAKPIEVPMPKKLELPRLQSNEKPVNLILAKPENMKNRAWPKAEDFLIGDDDDSVGDEKNIKEKIQYANISKGNKNSIEQKRQWPDGKTMFKPQSPAEMSKVDTVDSKKYLSDSSSDLTIAPSYHHHHHKKDSSNYHSRSSVDSDLSNTRTLHSETTPYSLGKHQKTASPAILDASTRMLLDRGKRLHNRKCDFVNERAAERNPYLRDAFNEEKKSSLENSDSDDNDDLSNTYRAKTYSIYSNNNNNNNNNKTRFPTSRYIGRPNIIHRYDYTPSYRARRIPIVSSLSSPIINTASPNRNYPYSSSSATARSLYGLQNASRHKESKDNCIQTDTDTSSADEVELNSATEISTDSEFDHDELMRETPKIFIDDTHLRKPTKVQIKSTVLPPATGHTCNNFSHNNKAQIKIGSYLSNYQVKPPPVPQFKPLVQVDPSLLTTNRTPLKNPRIGDYLLNKTASTEGIASKKSLELKKRYLLGEPTNGSKIQKSGSTSILDSRIRSFQSNISECQKLLNPGNEISPGMKSFLDRTKLGEQIGGERMRSATNDILNDLRVEITIQKTSSTASTDNEKENVFVNSKNVLNKGLEYAETVNTALMESLHKKALTTPPKITPKLIETINLITPEKVDKSTEDSNRIIDLTCDTPEKDNCIGVIPSNQKNDCLLLNSVESVNKVSDRSSESPMKSDRTIIEDLKPDVSKDIKHSIPDILNHIELEEIQTERRITCLENDENKTFLSNEEDNEEKADSPEKLENLDVCDVKIQVPNIPWSSLKTGRMSSSTDSSCSSHSSSVEDIEHYILESTTSPETHNSTSQYHQVPRVEVHDSSGTLMQIDSLMIIDGKYIGDPEDLKYMEIPGNLIIPPPQPPPPVVQICTLEYHTEADPEPLTTSPEPMENTIIDAPKKKNEHIYSTSDKPSKELASKVKVSDLKFDTKNENKVESLKNLPLIVEQINEQDRVVKPRTLNLKSAAKLYVETGTRLTPEDIDADRTPTIELLSRGSDSETDPTGAGHILTETELSDWTADDCLSENFIDLEFVLNPNKDTVKRIRKGKKKYDTSKLPSSSEVLLEVTKTAPVAKFEGILKSIGIDDIEFMDTVSDIIEPQSHPTTNRVSSRNRGYIEAKTYTNNKHKHITAPLKGNLPGEWQQQIQIKRDEKLGIDYIEQGAYIMQDDLNKTPVNETAGLAPAGDGVNVKTLQSSQMTQSLTDTSTLNDIEEDSTCALTLQLSSATGTGTGSSLAASTTTITTNKNSVSQPESEALTVVTSPLDSSSLKIHVGDVISEEGASSSSERIPKTSLSTESTFNSPSSKVTPPSSPKDNNNEAIGVSTNYRKSTEEISYEEYVRALQQKITQISAARGDSLDSRKQRRKSSKSEVPNSSTSLNSTTATSTCKITQTVIETNCINAAALATTTPTYSVRDNRDLKTFDAQNSGTAVNSSSSCKVPEIPTLTRRLEEITKERTKQKDLIHDLVMDKLQSKKQLNAEKRLNRSRQRSLLTSPNARNHGNGGTSQSPSSHTPIESTTIAGGTCTNNKAHYHLSTAVTKQPEQRLFKSSSFKEDKSSSTYTSPYSSEAATPTTAGTTRFSKQRPCSENFKVDTTKSLMTLLTQKPTTPIRTPNVTKPGCQEISAVNCFTPVPPLRQNRGRQASIPGASQSANIGESAYSISTENLRSEARARARLKSNTELGLSPEEKMLLLRKRLQADYPKNNTKDFPIKVSSRLGNASKSVNDLTYYINNNNNVNSNQNQNSHLQHSENTIKKDDKAKGDFLSDPNLLSLSPTKTKTGRRIKNPERRKSLIQSLTNFFHKNAGSTQQQRENNHNHDECSVTPVTAKNNSAASERPSTGGSSNSTTTTTSTSHTISSSIDGMLSRFRISPRSKEKSKDKMRPLNSYTSASAQCLQIIGKLSGSTVGHNDYRSSTPHSLHTSSSSNCKFTHKINSNTQLHNSQSSQQPQHQHQSIKKQELENEPRGNLHVKLFQKRSASSSALAFSSSSSPPISVNKSRSMTNATIAHCNDQTPPPIPPLPLNYQRSDDESNTTENREHKKQQRAMSKATRQAELKRLRIAQEIQREQEEIEVQLKELEGRGVLIEKALRGEAQNYDNPDISSNVGGSDEMLLKELLEIWRNITHLKQRDEELSIRQTELQLEYRHAQLKEELNLRLSTNKLEKNSADVAAEGAILNEMLEIVAKRAALRPSISSGDLIASSNVIHTPDAATVSQILLNSPHEQTHHINETNV